MDESGVERGERLPNECSIEDELGDGSGSARRWIDGMNRAAGDGDDDGDEGEVEVEVGDAVEFWQKRRKARWLGEGERLLEERREGFGFITVGYCTVVGVYRRTEKGGKVGPWAWAPFVGALAVQYKYRGSDFYLVSHQIIRYEKKKRNEGEEEEEEGKRK
jgi:hypothetical protein